MQIITNSQKAAIAVMCQQLGIDADGKADLVHQFSGGRTTTSKKLTMKEAAELLQHLSKLMKPDAATLKMTGKVLSLAHQLGWTKISKRTGRRVADGEKLDEWLVKYSYLHKKLNKYKTGELPKLISQMEKYLKFKVQGSKY